MIVVDSGIASAKEQMAIDRHLLETMGTNTPCILRFYSWKVATLTHGLFVDPSHLLSEQSLAQWNIETAKRPTAGGISFHFNDFPFSLILPRTIPLVEQKPDEIYHYIHSLVLLALQKTFPKETFSFVLVKQKPENTSFCLASPVPYDIAYKGEKIAGGALRRTKKGLLYQGFIRRHPFPPLFLDKVAHPPLNSTPPLSASNVDWELFKTHLAHILTKNHLFR